MQIILQKTISHIVCTHVANVSCACILSAVLHVHKVHVRNLLVCCAVYLVKNDYLFSFSLL